MSTKIVTTNINRRLSEPPIAQAAVAANSSPAQGQITGPVAHFVVEAKRAAAAKTAGMAQPVHTPYGRIPGLSHPDQ